jgi:hypothetical protein
LIGTPSSLNSRPRKKLRPEDLFSLGFTFAERPGDERDLAKRPGPPMRSFRSSLNSTESISAQLALRRFTGIASQTAVHDGTTRALIKFSSTFKNFSIPFNIFFEHSVAPGYMRETGNDALMERVDDRGHVIGFSILGVSRFRREKPFEAELPTGK